MPNTEKDLYFVAVKIFLEKDDKFLILKDGFGEWDIPGGRIRIDEFDTPLEKIVERKMAEELGSKIHYSLGKPVVFMRHERAEAIPGNPQVRIFAVGYRATLENGEIELTSHHTDMLWVSQTNFKPDKYFRGGWLKGVQEYLNKNRGK